MTNAFAFDLTNLINLAFLALPVFLGTRSDCIEYPDPQSTGLVVIDGTVLPLSLHFNEFYFRKPLLSVSLVVHVL